VFAKFSKVKGVNMNIHNITIINKIRQLNVFVILFSWIFLVGMSTSMLHVLGQEAENITILCGEFDPSYTSLPDPFPGAFYYVAQYGVVAPDFTWRFGRITQNEQFEFEAPISPELAQRLSARGISPDERRIVFAPNHLGTTLAVWDIQTGEIATLELENDLADYLQYEPESRDLWNIYFRKLVWRDSNHLAIQYFGNRDFPPAVSQIEIAISETPLRLTTTTPLTELVLADASVAVTQSTLNAPNENYRAVINGVNDVLTQSLQILDGSNRVLFEVQVLPELDIVGDTLWLSDGNALFYTERLLTETESGLRLVQLDTVGSVVRDNYLERLLENQFGSSLTFSSEFTPILSNDGRSVAFSFFAERQQQWYTIKYTPQTQEVIAVCDEELSSGNLYPFWIPGDNHVAYWQGNIKIYDFANGNRYILPYPGFIGWVDVNPDAPALRIAESAQ